MNDTERGYHRDSRIVQGVAERKALTTEQVRCLYFQSMRYGRRKAQERLLKLVRQGRLKRTRVGGEYAYYVERPLQLDHTIAVNWCRLYLEQDLQPYRRLTWQQPDYGFLRPDALAVVEDTRTGSVYGWYVEADLSDNYFNKASLYCRLYESGAYEGEWWVERVRAFPGILVATHRPVAVRRAVRRDNVSGLRFVVKDWVSLRGEVSGGKAGVSPGGGDRHSGLPRSAVHQGDRQAAHSGAGEAAGDRPAPVVGGAGGVRRHRVGSGILPATGEARREAHQRGRRLGEVLGLYDQVSERG